MIIALIKDRGGFEHELSAVMVWIFSAHYHTSIIMFTDPSKFCMRMVGYRVH